MIGIDLDNTIIDYDEAFQAIALREGMITPEIPAEKNAIRDYLRAQPGGEEMWRRLQALAYGREIARAKPMPGALEFVRECCRRGVPVVVVSHKSERATADPDGPDLRRCAVDWLAANGFFGADTGLTAECVFFGATRGEKVAFIRALACTDFIDDLPETFQEAAFPRGVRGFLFTRDASRQTPAAVTGCGSWRDILLETVGDPAHEAQEAAVRLLGSVPDYVRAVTGGRNSRVYEVRARGERYALKQYFQPADDQRDRMRTEFDAVTLLRSAGISSVPDAVGLSAEYRWALYTWIDGTKVAVGTVTQSEIDDAVSFLGSLRAISGRYRGVWKAAASEARFSVADIARHVEQRLHVLGDSPHVQRMGSAVGAFVRDRLEPLVAEAAADARRQCEATGVSYDRELEPAERTLSPSDFGFHNALRGSGGGLVFVDFEYFGWDDPAKTVCDFVLHPAMQLSRAQKTRFVERMFDEFRSVPRLQERVSAVYPLFGLKWVLIILNEFLPQHLLRRRFAGLLGERHEELLSAQLAKASALLGEIEATRGKFPYS